MGHSEQGNIRIMRYRVPFREENMLNFIGEALATVYEPESNIPNDFENLLEQIK